MKFFSSSFSRVPKHQRFEFKPRYYNPDSTQEKDLKERIKFRRGALYNDGPNYLTGKLKGEASTHRRRYGPAAILYRIVLLLLMLTDVGYYFYFEKGLIWSLFFLLILMILFIRSNNKP